jgi:hypothetical protein
MTMKTCPKTILIIWALGVLTLPLLLVAGVAGAQAPGTTCASGKFVFGNPGPQSVPLPAGDYDISVRTFDAYAGRATAWPGDQTHESIVVAGRTTPDLADNVEAAEWSGAWRWTSPGVLTIGHGWPGSGAHSVSYEVCATPVPPLSSTTTTTAPPVVEEGDPEPEPVEVLPSVVPVPVVQAPSFTG